jgi:hypothetical protein
MQPRLLLIIIIDPWEGTRFRHMMGRATPQGSTSQEIGNRRQSRTSRPMSKSMDNGSTSLNGWPMFQDMHHKSQKRSNPSIRE